MITRYQRKRLEKSIERDKNELQKTQEEKTIRMLKNWGVASFFSSNTDYQSPCFYDEKGVMQFDLICADLIDNVLDTLSKSREKKIKEAIKVIKLFYHGRLENNGRTEDKNIDEIAKLLNKSEKTIRVRRKYGISLITQMLISLDQIDYFLCK